MPAILNVRKQTAIYLSLKLAVYIQFNDSQGCIIDPVSKDKNSGMVMDTCNMSVQANWKLKDSLLHNLCLGIVWPR